MVGNTYMSPVDSAIGSGVATKAPSVVGEDDLEKFEDGDLASAPPGGGGYYPGYPEQQGRGKKYMYIDVCVWGTC